MFHRIRRRGLTLLILLCTGCSRTALNIPPGRPTPDFECARSANIPAMTFSLGFDSTFRNDPRVLRVTWILRNRCLLRTERWTPDSTPGNCPPCFYLNDEYVRVGLEGNSRTMEIRPPDPPFTLTTPVVTSRSLSFKVLNARSARWCIEGYLELIGGETIHFGPVTLPLTFESHIDPGFMVTRTGNTTPPTAVIRAEFIADHSYYGRTDP